ncbi:MAG: hypothetical protein QOI11_1000 [Candidatus Eremiobacteraeota bacterium]|jgi:hypothetical protein|nr:hypothetical protein [Candidatus Eremiobacteraeota bacterium]
MFATDLTAEIDERNLRFTSAVKERLKDLNGFSLGALEWLMLEHFQFSSANPGFLDAAARLTEALPERGISRELRRNFYEESGHAAIYRRGLSQAGADPDARAEFAPTSAFLAEIEALTASAPAQVLGAMYATETAAIFEHEVFWDVSREVCARKGLAWETSILKGFHDMHLSGVEQGHKDGLAAFVGHGAADDAQVRAGAERAIDTMTRWWDALLAEAQSR